jgi:PadR family transcriptional regulator
MMSEFDSGTDSETDIMADPITRHFFTGFIRLHVLYHAAKEPVYGAEITEELIRHGYRVSQGTLYPTLHQMEELGYLDCEERKVEGRRRKYYTATVAGRKVLAEARQKLQELVAEVLEDNDQPFQTIREKRDSASRTRQPSPGRGRKGKSDR